MAWWKTLFESTEAMRENAYKEAERRRYEAESEMLKKSPHAVASSVSVGTISMGGSPPIDFDMLMELSKLAKALNLHTAEDVRKVFGELYDDTVVVSTTSIFGGTAKK